MSDLNHTFGCDISLSSTGDLSCTTGTTLVEQRVLRRLLTNPGDYLWQLSYGAGLPVMIGTPTNTAGATAIVRSQLFLEANVSRSPPPTVTLQPDQSTVYLTVSYSNTLDATTQVIETSFGL